MVEVYPVRASSGGARGAPRDRQPRGDVAALEVELDAMKRAVKREDTKALVEHE